MERRQRASPGPYAATGISAADEMLYADHDLRDAAVKALTRKPNGKLNSSELSPII